MAKPMNDPGLDLFHPLIRRWFVETLGEPTDVQRRAWPAIAAGEHVLVTAPTGSGKTLTAFLWAIDRLVNGAWPMGETAVLYISPLKALNNDIRKNLLTPLEELRGYFSREGVLFPEIRVLTRSGDTPADERRRMARRPPEILITTPESLNILLLSKPNRALLRGVRTVILDEIHAVAGAKRGTHLITAVDRLVPLCGEFQRVALSATVRPLNAVADFIGGYLLRGAGPDARYEKRRVRVIESTDRKRYEIAVRFPRDGADARTAGSAWPALVRRFKEIIAANRSTLFFVNSRRTAEKLTRLINEDEPTELAYSHHGSLSREIRLEVERKLKEGELRAIVATNSLELGIDIGDLDAVVLVQTPRSIASAIQRIGRAGHRVGLPSRGELYPTHGRDFTEAAVMAQAVMERDIEELRIPAAPLDVLAQVIIAMTAMETWDIDALHAFIRASAPYHDLPRRHYDLVLEMLAGRYADTRLRELAPRVSVDRVDNTVRARDGATFLLFSAGGTIPDRGYFTMRLRGSGARIGELDEEFVWERSAGESFAFGAQLWRIEAITHNEVEVIPAADRLNFTPFWRADARSRGFHLSDRYARFLERLDRALDTATEGDIMDLLGAEYRMDGPAAAETLDFLKRQRAATGTPLPHRHHLLVEQCRDPFAQTGSTDLVLHSPWGGAVNRPWALAIAAAWEKAHGTPLQTMVNDDGILFMLPHPATGRELLDPVTPENLEALLRGKLEGSAVFGAHFRENAGRALLLPRRGFRHRTPLWQSRLRAKKLLDLVQRYDDFPILIETWRSCLKDEFDLPALGLLLEELQTGEIVLGEIETASPSPFAGGLIWKQTNSHMYQDDTPNTPRTTGLAEEVLREFVFAPHLRPRIPAALVAGLDARLKRTAPGFTPGSPDELLDWVKERLLIPVPEWEELLGAIGGDGGDPAAMVCEIDSKAAIMKIRGSGPGFVCALETLRLIRDAFGLAPAQCILMPLSPGEACAAALRGNSEREQLGLRTPQRTDGEAGYTLVDFLAQWLAYYGPVPRTLPAAYFPLPAPLLDEALAELEEARAIVVDYITEDAADLEICDAGHLETLLRMLRRSRRPAFEPLQARALPLFLAAWQGLARREGSAERLQERLEQLFGYPAPAASWEEYILPARLDPYYPGWLDTLMQSSDLAWRGCGKGRLYFLFGEDLPLFAGDDAPEPERGADLDRYFPSTRGRYPFFEIVKHAQSETAQTARDLWELAWTGAITNDSYVTVRLGILNDFAADRHADAPVSRRSGYSRWAAGRPLAGSWYRFPAESLDEDLLTREEANRDRARQLFRRYGILFRELLSHELPALQWKSLFRTLRQMELSGEILTGHFFRDLPGPQFITPGAFRMLQRPLPEDAVYWMNATDPASLCGLGLAAAGEGLPSRIPSSSLVYLGTEPVVLLRRNGQELVIRIGADHPRLRECLRVCTDLLSRQFNPLKKLLVETINDEPATRSPYADALIGFGFRRAHLALELWREY